MSKHAFEVSLVEGRHNEIAKWVGDWEGITRVWFEPDKLGDEAPIRGSIRSTLGGRCLVHEYETLFLGEPEQGIALLTWHIDRQCFECAWIDSAHTGTQISLEACATRRIFPCSATMAATTATRPGVGVPKSNCWMPTI